MKSLEIVNSKIKHLKKRLYKLNDTKEGTVEDFEKYNLECELKEQLEIKEDLTALCFLKNHLNFYSSNHPDSEWCDLIGLGNVPGGPLDQRTPAEYKFVKDWFYKEKKGVIR